MKNIDRSIIVTGASSGIGREMSEQLAQPGTGITLVARREEKLNQVASRVESSGGTALVAAHDVQEVDSMKTVVETTCDAFGQLNYVVANAGVSWKTESHDLNRENVLRTFRINVDGMINLFDPALDVMLKQDFGQLVAVSSMASFHGLPGKSAYCASKSAMAQIAESFRLDLIDTGVGVTTVYPGYVETPMTEHYPEGELPFKVSVERAAETIITAMKRNKKRCLFPWQMKLMTGLMNYLPSTIVERVIKRTAAAMTDTAPKGPTTKKETDLP